MEVVEIQTRRERPRCLDLQRPHPTIRQLHVSGFFKEINIKSQNDPNHLSSSDFRFHFELLLGFFQIWSSDDNLSLNLGQASAEQSEGQQGFGTRMPKSCNRGFNHA